MSASGGRFDGDAPHYRSYVFEPRPEAVALMQGITKRQVEDFSVRLGRVSRFRWAALWLGVGTLIVGAVIGGGFGLIGFLAQTPGPGSTARLVYFVALGFGLVIALVCFAAYASTRKERAESVSAIKDDLDRLLNDYPTFR